MLEHRWSERLVTDREPVIIATGNDSVPATLCDASLGGLYLETDAKLAKNASVQILLRMSNDNHAEWCRLQAVVVHQSDRGVGVLVDISKHQARHTLQALVQHYQERRLASQTSPANARQQAHQISNA